MITSSNSTRTPLLTRPFFNRSVHSVAPELVGTTLLVDGIGGVIVEVEAYHHTDPAAHSFGGRTPRNAVMFGPAGRLYVYRSYGIHNCANTAAGPEGVGWGILIRGGEVVDGASTAARRRGRGSDLANGPGKLCQALGITIDLNGTDLLNSTSIVRLEEGERPAMVMATPRVGISRAKDVPWRFVAASQLTA
jgi:DNA-3-methyladenine glycosylase